MPETDDFLRTAAEIGTRLCGEAVWHADRCNWLGDAMDYVDGGWQVVHRSCGVGLYDGTGGIALFLAALHRATGDRVVRATARGALRHAFANAHLLPPYGRLGLYSGLAGLAYAAIEAGTALGDEMWASRGHELLASLTPDTDDGQALDVIAGAAGAIPLLLRFGNGHAHEVARSLGDRLLLRAQRENGYVSWDTMQTPGGRNLTGYSHGAAGIALALLELGTVTGEARFLSTAGAAIAYERHHFVADYGNWPDFRSDVQSPGAGSPYASGGVACSTAWCHGAPGIGLARLRTYHLTREAAALEEVGVSLRTTGQALERLAGAGPGDFSLCHGASGLAELFLSASTGLGNNSYAETARRIGAWGIERIAAPRLPWPCGVLNGGETPTLLTGLAGIGHFYLRLAQTDRVPSVLLMEGPSPRLAAVGHPDTRSV